MTEWDAWRRSQLLKQAQKNAEAEREKAQDPVVWTDVTPQDRQYIEDLAGCTFLPASYDKSFVHGLYTWDGSNRQIIFPEKISVKQRENLRRLHHRYRRQHGRRTAGYAD